MNITNKAQAFCPLATSENLKETLEKYGVAVLTDVFADNECEKVKAKMLEYLAHEHYVTEPDDYKKLRPMRGGMMKYFGIALHKEILDLKTDERVVDKFRQIWNEQNLTTSLDSIYISPPSELKSSKEFFDPFHRLWFHTDQSSDKKGLHCIQSFINLETIDDGDGCISVLAYIHKYHQEFFENFNEDSKGNWFVMKNKHLDWYMSEKTCPWWMITAPKGSMVFWDSRTIHMGTLPREDRVNKDRWRFIVYVCYTPARWQSKEDARLKRDAYIHNCTTSHWPYGVNVFGNNYRRINRLENLTERHKQLLGLNIE